MANVMPPLPPSSTSPTWGSTTKMVVGLTFVAIVAALLIRFRSIIGPLILAFMLAYLLHPVTNRFSLAARLPWRTSVNIIYLIMVVFLVALSTLAGLAIIQQIQSLIEVIQHFVNTLPEIVADLSTRIYVFGPFQLNLSQLNLEALINQLGGMARTLLTRATSLISSFATTTVATVGWALFVILISYFLLADTDQMRGKIVPVDIPGYTSDVRRLERELRNIWNAFLRGQMIIIGLVIVFYTILMSVLGVRYALGIALMAGLARFVPYVGPLVTGVVTFLVAFLQGENYFGFQPLQYAILVVVSAVILDQIFDNLVSPRFLGHTLGVHPAAVLIVAIIAANLIGIIGLVLAAPVLATVKLLSGYVLSKMFDMDPWPERVITPPPEMPWTRGVRRLRAWARMMQQRK